MFLIQSYTTEMSQFELDQITSSGVINVSAFDYNRMIVRCQSIFTYDEFVAGSSVDLTYRLSLMSPDRYIYNEWLTPTMRDVFQQSEMYHRQRTDDPHILRLKRLRGRITHKIAYMKRKLGNDAYPYESGLARALVRERREAAQTEERRAGIVLFHTLFQGNNIYDAIITPATPAIKVTNLNYDGPTDHVCEDDCSICMTQHTTIDMCKLSCGHAFGTKCVTSWTTTNGTCPLCRAKCVEMYVNTQDKNTVIKAERRASAAAAAEARMN